MRKVLFFLLLILGVRASAQATCNVNYPYIFVNNVSTVDANTMMADLNDVRTCARTVDNTQIGSAGIYASQVIPTSALQATFGGTIGYTFAGYGNNQTPLTVAAPAAPSVDILDVTNNNGATKYFSVDSTGLAHFNANPGFVDLTTAQTIAGVKTFSAALLSANGYTAASSTYGPTSASVNGTIDVQSGGSFTVVGGKVLDGAGNDTRIFARGPSGLVRFYGSGQTTEVGAADTVGVGMMSRAGNAFNSLAYMPPVYTSSGAATAATLHSVIGTFTSCTFSSSQTCAGTTVALSGAAVFASTTSFSCNVDLGANVAYVAFTVTHLSASSLQVYGISPYNTSNTYSNLPFTCTGT